MFTGIVTDIGEIIELEQRGDLRVCIATRYDTSQIDLGASIACNGICLTVVDKGVKKDRNWFEVEVSAESAEVTNIQKGRKTWQVGSKINLERALKLGDELGGHIVSGHVDGVAELIEMTEVGDSTVVKIETTPKLSAFIAEKGSVTLDGTSLTVNEVDGCKFTINLIPHTKTQTIWGEMQVGDKINLEVDTLARYVARLAQVRDTNTPSSTFKPSSEHIQIAGQTSETK